MRFWKVPYYWKIPSTGICLFAEPIEMVDVQNSKIVIENELRKGNKIAVRLS